MSMIGGHIMAPVSFFLAVRDESEFAVMLAHSIAHIALNHGRSQSGAANGPLIFLGGWTGLHADARTASESPRSYLETMRRNEIEADQLGMKLAAGAGYDPAALREYLQRTPSSWREERLAGLNEFLGTAEPVASVSGSDFLQARLVAEAVSLAPRPVHPPTLRRSK
jgi:predicted Zn-dependent protease